MASLSDKPASWEDEVRATPDLLTKPASFTTIHHLLSTAVSRKPQAALLGAVKGRVASLLDDVVGTQILTDLLRFGTPATVAEVSEQLQKANPDQLLTKGEAAVELLCEVARRVDSEKGARKPLLQAAVVKALSPKRFLSDTGLRAVAAVLVGDDALGGKVVSVLGDRSVKQWLSDALLAKKPSKADLSFATTALKQASGCSEPTIAAAVAEQVLSAVSKGCAPASTRPRAELLIAIVEHGDEKTRAALCKLVSKWKDLKAFVSSPNGSKLVAALLRLADGAQALAESIVSAVPLAQLVAGEASAGARVAVAIRERGLSVEGADGNAKTDSSVRAVDAAQDCLNRRIANCARASRVAALRGIDRLSADAASPAGAKRQRPLISLSDEDEDDSVKPPVAAKGSSTKPKQPAAEQRSTPSKQKPVQKATNIKTPAKEEDAPSAQKKKQVSSSPATKKASPPPTKRSTPSKK